MTMTMTQWFGGVFAEQELTDAHTSENPFRLDTYAWNYKRLWRFKCTGTQTPFVRLPDARDIPAGAEIYFMENVYDGNNNDISIRDYDGIVAGTLHDQPTIPRPSVFHLIDNSTAAGKWVMTIHQEGQIYPVTHN